MREILIGRTEVDLNKNSVSQSIDFLLSTTHSFRAFLYPTSKNGFFCFFALDMEIDFVLCYNEK